MDVFEETKILHSKAVAKLIPQLTHLSRDEVESLHDASQFRQLVGRLIYLTITKLDICLPYTVSVNLCLIGDDPTYRLQCVSYATLKVLLVKAYSVPIMILMLWLLATSIGTCSTCQWSISGFLWYFLVVLILHGNFNVVSLSCQRLSVVRWLTQPPD